MYSGRAGCWLLLSAWHGADCKEFPEEVVDEVCEGSAGAGAGAGLGQGDNHLCRVSPLLSSPLLVLQFFVLHLAPARSNLTVTDTLHCTAPR